MIDDSQFDARGGDDAQASPLALLAFYWGLLRKYYWIVLLTSLVSVTAGYFWTKQQPFLYRTQTKIIFHNKSNALGNKIERVDLMDPGGVWQFEQFWNTQREVLGSRWFAERVAKKIGMLEGDTYVPINGADGQPLSDEARLKIAAGQIRGTVSYELQRDSRVAIIAATSSDPQFAKLAVDGFANAYVDYTKEIQSGGLNKLIAWFDTYVGNMRRDVEESQTALNQYKRDKDILAESFENRQGLTSANMEAVNTALNAAIIELAKEEALARQLRDMLKNGATETQAARFAGSEQLTGLLAQRRELEQKLAELSTVYGPKHESVRAVSVKLDLVENAIREEIELSLSVVDNGVEVLKRQKVAYEERLNYLKQEIANLNDIGVKYMQMKDRTESMQQLYKTVLERSKELDINSMLDSNTVQVLEEAEVPGGPFSPNLPINLLIALGIGVALGGGVIFLIAALDNTIKGEEDVLRYTRTPLIGALPELDKQAIAGLVGNEGSMDMVTHLAPKSSFAEGIKTLRTNLMFMSADKPPALLLVTSPGPGEGKTLISTNMAIAMAQSGLRTLIVDCDLRRPRVHKAIGVKNDAGVSDVVAGQAKLDDVLQATDVENLWMMTAGHIPPNPSELLHTEAFAKMITSLRGKFDRVIVDSPPIGAVADALILSRTVDGVMLVLKFGQTRRELFRRAIDQLEGIGAPLMGVVLNDVKRSAGGYGYSYYYYRYNYDDRPDAGSGKKGKKLAS